MTMTVCFLPVKKELQRLSGVGVNTAGAICAYSFNLPSIFIETNIRTVYLHHFFPDQTGITDKDIMIRLDETLDRDHPREWYWALMDYGTWLKNRDTDRSARVNTIKSSHRFGAACEKCARRSSLC